jgi:hypothetical protein
LSLELFVLSNTSNQSRSQTLYVSSAGTAHLAQPFVLNAVASLESTIMFSQPFTTS